jgi:tellurite resistance protein TerC
MIPLWLWAAFLGFILLCLALDLGVFHRKARAVGLREALAWFAVWTALSLLFSVFVYFLYERKLFGITPPVGGRRAAMDYLSSFILEKALSLDNIFVIALIFGYFRVPSELQHRVLFWGVLGAIVMRMAFIAVGVALIRHFDWIMYVFGGFLLWTAFKMLTAPEHAPDPERNPFVRAARKLYPVCPTFDGPKFFTQMDGRRAITPLFLVLLLVESTDIVFAVDSIPAVLGITDDAFIVFTSNIFAILGLRSLFFALAALMGRFRYLKYSLVFLLAFIGVKMIAAHELKARGLEPPAWASLAVIASALAIGVGASWVIPPPVPPKRTEEPAPPPRPE